MLTGGYSYFDNTGNKKNDNKINRFWKFQLLKSGHLTEILNAEF